MLTAQQGMVTFMADFGQTYDGLIRMLQITKRPIMGEVRSECESLFNVMFKASAMLKAENEYYTDTFNGPDFTAEQKQVGTPEFLRLIMYVGQPRNHLRGEHHVRATALPDLPVVKRRPDGSVTPGDFAELGEGRFYKLLTSAEINDDTRDRWMGDAVDFMYAMVVSIVNRFRYDWEFLWACRVVDPATMSMNFPGRPAVEHMVNILMHEIPFLRRLPDDNKANLRLHAVRMAGVR